MKTQISVAYNHNPDDWKFPRTYPKKLSTQKSGVSLGFLIVMISFFIVAGVICYAIYKVL